MSATTKPIKDKIPAQAYLLHTICFLDTGSDTADMLVRVFCP